MASRRAAIGLIAMSFAAFVSTGGACAQDYPSRPVRWVVGYPPGGATDILARLIGQRLSERLGQQFIIENKPGAGNNVGTEAVVTSKIGLSALVSTNTDLIMLRIVTYSLFAVLMATRLVRARKAELTRQTLRAPFYSQCYVVALLAILLGAATILIRLAHTWSLVTGVVLALAALLWFGTLQTAWFVQHLKCSRLRAFGHASRAMVESLAAVLLLSNLFS